MISQVLVCGGVPASARRPMRETARTRNTNASAARMYLVAILGHICESSRCWRQAGALVLNSGVPGFNRER